MKFEVNNDLKRINLDWHNICHVFAGIILAWMYNPIVAYIILLAWEYTDGLKPWFYTFTYDNTRSKFYNFARRELIFSNKFSYQDAFVWNIIGCLLGWLLLLVL
jgi:hypothetical protein